VSSTPTKHPSFLRQSTITIMLAFFGAQLLTVTCTASLLMWPIMQKGTEDLSSLMLQSVSQWLSLPENKRADYANSVNSKYDLIINSSIPENAITPVLPYVVILKNSLAEKIGHEVTALTYETDQKWYFFILPMENKLISVAFPQTRIGTAPKTTIGIVLFINILISVLTSYLIAKRVIKPVKDISDATREIGRGVKPGNIDESGPEEIANLARRFNIMAEQVRELVEQRTILLSGISHDLRAPLSRLSCSLEMMRENPDSKHLNRIENQIILMSTLIDQRLDDSKTMQVSEPVYIELSGFLKDFCKQYENYVGGFTVNANEIINLYVDAEALKRVLDNIITNAVRYSSGQLIEVSCFLMNDSVSIQVLDSGKGIPEADIDRVQSPFVRLLNDAEESGSGLGLAIVNQICNRHGWLVKIENAFTGGLLVSIILNPTF